MLSSIHRLRPRPTPQIRIIKLTPNILKRIPMMRLINHIPLAQKVHREPNIKLVSRFNPLHPTNQPQVPQYYSTNAQPSAHPQSASHKPTQRWSTQSSSSCIIADEVGLDLRLAVYTVGRGMPCREDDLIAHAADFQPLAKPFFGFLGLVVICSLVFSQ